MDRCKRPAFARHGMMRPYLPLALALALLLAGCGGNSNVQFASNTTPSGGVSTGGSVQARSQSALGVLIAIGVLMGVSYANDRQQESEGNRYQPNFFAPEAPSMRAPELDPSRRVREQDCTRPIEDRSANLKCR